MPDLYDRSGEPLSFARWVLLFEDRRYRQLALDRRGEYTVSTVWLGIDHGYGYSEEPVIFETMVFKGRPVEQYRYTTEEEALAGHARVLEEIALIEAARA